MAETVKLRVVFEDASILRRSQRLQGLEKCWLLLRPDIVTIADLAAHIEATFGLHSSCPHGLIISMDGFVLPVFESASILKDESIIMIKRNGIMFQDIVKFPCTQNQEQVLESRQISASNNRNLKIMNRQIDSQDDKNDFFLITWSAPNKKKNEHCKRKSSKKFQGSNKTLTIKDSLGDSLGDDGNVCLHENITYRESTSNEMVNVKCKKKRKELQTTGTLANKDSESDSQVKKGDLILPIPHKETSSSKMIKMNRKRKHFDKLQGSDDTLDIKNSQRNSHREEEDNGLHRNIALKEATSNEMLDAKHKRKHSNKLKAYPLTIKNSQGDPQVDERDLWLLNRKTTRKEASCEMKIAKHKGKCSNIPQGSDNELAVRNSQGDEKEAGLQNGNISPNKTLIKRSNVMKRRHFNKLQASDKTFAIKDSQGDSLGDDENVCLHENITYKEHTSNEMMNVKCKKKRTNELQTSDTLAKKDSQSDSLVKNGDLIFPIPLKETSSSEMIKLNIKRKHFDKRQGYDTLAIKDSQRNSHREEEDSRLHQIISHKEAASNEMLDAKYKRKHSKKLKADPLTIENSQGDPLVDGDLSLFDRKRRQKEASSEMKNAKHKGKCSNISQGSENKSIGNGDAHVSKNDANGDARKVPSRSARRHKAKRLWHRTFGSTKEEKLIEIHTLEGDNRKKIEHANGDQRTDEEKKIVPVIVRPGHIRFESSDTYGVRADEPVETFQWNGTISKKKGQKWGRENTFNKCNDDASSWLSHRECSDTNAEQIEVSNEKSAVESYEECIVNQGEPVKDCNENSSTKESEAVTKLIEFESLSPLCRLPEEGDVLAYRLVELSSSWCPELSPFRVGRVSSYDCSSSKVIVLPLPEYPLILEEISEEGQVSRSLYTEDGTLEVDYTSLVDVRLFKAGESIKTTHSTTGIGETQNVVPINNPEMQNSAPVNNQQSASCSSNRVANSSNHTVNDQLFEGWEAIDQVLNERKSQLQKQNGLDEGNSSSKAAATTTGPWSYKALRRNALGPTLAMLRSSNGDSGK